MDNIIYAHLNGKTVCKTAPVYQYNHGMKLELIGVNFPDNFRADFSNDEHGTSKAVLGSGTSVSVPYEYFVPGATIHCWIVISGDDYTVTKLHIMIPVSGRAQPTDEEPDPEEQGIIDQAIAALNEAVAATGQDVIATNAAKEAAQGARAGAETAQTKAEQAQEAAEGAQTAAETAQSNAQSYATDAATSAREAAQAAQKAAEDFHVLIQQDVETSQIAAQTATAKASEAAQAAADAETAKSKAEQAESSAKAAQQDATTAKNNAQNYAANASGSANIATAKANEASASAASAKLSETSAASSVRAASQSAEEAAASAVLARNAKTDAEIARDSAETSETNAAASAEAAAQSAADVAELGESVAKEVTAQDILDETKTISDNLNELVEINRSIRYYAELPEEGTEGYTYITPDGIFHYEKGEYIQISGSGDLNGFSLTKDEENRVVLTYVNPEDETDTDSTVMATETTGNDIVAELQAINAALYQMIPAGT